jgi:hypothetical protein
MWSNSAKILWSQVLLLMVAFSVGSAFPLLAVSDAMHGQKKVTTSHDSPLRVSVSSVGGTNVQAAAFEEAGRCQNACHCPASPLNNARR